MPFLVIAIVLGLAALAAGLIVSRLVHVCQPNEVLVFTGMRRHRGDKPVGYQLVQGGRGVRLPLLERVHRLDLTNMIIELDVRGAYSKGGIPLHVQGVANVKIASDEPTIGNAIERFLTKSRGAIVAIAKETLEGNLRGVLATLTPEEVNQDRVKFAQSLLHEADADLKRLGLDLDTLKIQNVSDDKGYLDSIGRKQSAELVMRSRVAEARNQSLARCRSAENHRRAELARIAAERRRVEADATRRVTDAQTRQEAMIAEHVGQVKALVARAEGEVHVQRQQIERVKLKLEADLIKKAEARRTAMVQLARAEASPIVEDGKAQARALRTLAQSWREAGDDAARIFVAQKLEGLVDLMLAHSEERPVETVTLLAGDADLPRRAAASAAGLEGALGIDVPKLLARLAPAEG